MRVLYSEIVEIGAPAPLDVVYSIDDLRFLKDRGAINITPINLIYILAEGVVQGIIGVSPEGPMNEDLDPVSLPCPPYGEDCDDKQTETFLNFEDAVTAFPSL